VKLKEYEVKDFEAGSGGSHIAGTKVKLVTSSGGTASSIAAANGISTAALLAANPSISDPMDVPAGMTLNISGSIGGFSAGASFSFGF
jgi:LysM repeat protein